MLRKLRSSIFAVGHSLFSTSSEAWIYVFYVLMSLACFLPFFFDAPALIWDSGQYSDLSDDLIRQNFDLLTNNFKMRTYAHPLILAVLKIFADGFTIPRPQFIYVANFVLFLLTNLLIYWRVKPLSKPISRLFLMLSSFNVITLSFANTYLTENPTIFLTAVLFFLLAKPSLGDRSTFWAGVVSGFFIFLRPSTLILLCCVIAYIAWKQLQARKIVPFLLFFVGAAIPIILGLINTYNVDKQFGLFTKKTSGIFDMQVRQGVVWIKYETNIDPAYPAPTMYYIHHKNTVLQSRPCKGAAGCFVAYLLYKPLQYLITFGLHLFNLFDRVYLDTYIRNLPDRNPLLALGNYFVLTGAFLGVVFIGVKEKWKSIFLAIAVLFFGLIAIYIPTVVEPRFSAPIYPFMVLLCCYYLVHLVSLVDKKMVLRLLFLQLVLIMGCFMLSDLVDLTLFNGKKSVYQ